MKTAETILRETEKQFGGDITYWQQNWIIVAMETYAAQFQKDDRAAKTAALEKIREIVFSGNDAIKNAVEISKIVNAALASLPPESDQVNT